MDNLKQTKHSDVTVRIILIKMR